MKPFDLEKALAGAPVVTKSGWPVSELTQFTVRDGLDALYGVVNGRVMSWRKDGVFDHDIDGNDLAMAPVKNGCWLNTYLRGHHFGYQTKEEADQKAGKDRICCVYVEWEE